MDHAGKNICSLELPQLEGLLKGLQAAEAKRGEASKHLKFDKVNNKKAMEFPNTNPAFLKLKIAIEEEIRKRKNGVANI